MPLAAELATELALRAVGNDQSAAPHLMRASVAHLEEHRAHMTVLEGDVNRTMALDGGRSCIERNLANLAI